MVRQLTVTDINELDGCGRLDSIDIIVQNYRPGVGEMTIKCFGRSWTARWSAMSSRSVEEFVLSSDVWYLAKNFDQQLEAQQRVEDPDWEEILKAKLIERRLEGDFAREEARSLWNELEEWPTDMDPEHIDEDMEMVEKVAGYYCDWWELIPMEPNPKYEYLLRIISAVQQALKEVR